MAETLPCRACGGLPYEKGPGVQHALCCPVSVEEAAARMVRVRRLHAECKGYKGPEESCRQLAREHEAAGHHSLAAHWTAVAAAVALKMGFIHEHA